MGGKGGCGAKNFLPHPSELSIWAFPENLVKIGLLVEAVGNFLRNGMGRHGAGRHGDTSDYIDNLRPSLWLLAWLGSALAEVCQLDPLFKRQQKRGGHKLGLRFSI